MRGTESGARRAPDAVSGVGSRERRAWSVADARQLAQAVRVRGVVLLSFFVFLSRRVFLLSFFVMEEEERMERT